MAPKNLSLKGGKDFKYVDNHRNTFFSKEKGVGGRTEKNKRKKKLRTEVGGGWLINCPFDGARVAACARRPESLGFGFCADGGAHRPRTVATRQDTNCTNGGDVRNFSFSFCSSLVLASWARSSWLVDPLAIENLEFGGRFLFYFVLPCFLVSVFPSVSEFCLELRHPSATKSSLLRSLVLS